MLSSDLFVALVCRRVGNGGAYWVNTAFFSSRPFGIIWACTAAKHTKAHCKNFLLQSTYHDFFHVCVPLVFCGLVRMSLQACQSVSHRERAPSPTQNMPGNNRPTTGHTTVRWGRKSLPLTLVWCTNAHTRTVQTCSIFCLRCSGVDRKALSRVPSRCIFAFTGVLQPALRPLCEGHDTFFAYVWCTLLCGWCDTTTGLTITFTTRRSYHTPCQRGSSACINDAQFVVTLPCSYFCIFFVCGCSALLSAGSYRQRQELSTSLLHIAMPASVFCGYFWSAWELALPPSRSYRSVTKLVGAKIFEGHLSHAVLGPHHTLPPGVYQGSQLSATIARLPILLEKDLMDIF